MFQSGLKADNYRSPVNQYILIVELFKVHRKFFNFINEK